MSSSAGVAVPSSVLTNGCPSRRCRLKAIDEGQIRTCSHPYSRQVQHDHGLDLSREDAGHDVLERRRGRAVFCSDQRLPVAQVQTEGNR